MKTKLGEKINSLEQKPLEPFIIRALCSWCLTALILLVPSGLAFNDLKKYAGIGIIAFLIPFVLVFAALTVISVLTKNRHNLDVRALPVLFGIYSALLAFMGNDYYTAFVIAALWALLIYYYSSRGYLVLNGKKKEKRRKTLLAASVIVFIIVVGGHGVLRYVNYAAPNYDFGIFVNMFHNMRESFRPVTTCERDGLLSHFAIHISPIFYVLLPFYWIFPSGATLQLSQALILASAVIPMYLLAKHFGLSKMKTAVMCAVLLFHPAVASGTNYDMHENCFLLPLLLWVFYFFEKEKYIPLAVFTLLTLSVKEDAAVYIVFFALFVILSRRKYICGAALFAGAGLYFALCMILLTKFGNGVMSSRFANYIVADGGLAEAVKNVLADPGYVFTQIFIDKDCDYSAKLLFIVQLFAPLAFMPLCVKKISRLTLLFPMLLINLMTTYVYQYDIGFQYTFGTLAFLMYLAVMNVSEKDGETQKKFLCTALACAFLCFLAAPTGSFFTSLFTLADNGEDNVIITETLNEIPDDASVVCSTFLLPHLADREVIYETYYHKYSSDEKIDFVILDCRYESYKEILKKYSGYGFEVTETVMNASGEKELLLVMEKN